VPIAYLLSVIGDWSFARHARAAGQKKNRAYTQATLSPRTSRTPSLDHHQCSASYSGSRKKMMPTGR